MIVFVCTHKKISTPLIPKYKIIQCGGSTIYDGDDIGINISNRNWCYSEITGHYWIRHHINCDIIGTAMYHRWLGINGQMISEKQANEILKDYDIIVPFKELKNYTIREQFGMWHNTEDLELALDIMINLYPEYFHSRSIVDTYGIYRCNMMICSKELFNNYIDWLCSILEQVYLDGQYRFITYEHHRVCGYLAERLFNVWLYHNKLRVYETQLIEKGHNEFNI